MNPSEIGQLLGDIRRGDEVLAAIDPAAGVELSKAIRASFTPGNEQGNARRLRAVVALEGDGALDLLAAVLEDTVVVGGIYSNLRNTALALMAERFPGHPRLADPLWRAIEIDPFLNVLTLYPVAAAYDPARAVALLIPMATSCFPGALQLLARVPGGRAVLHELLDAAIAPSAARANIFVEALGPVALEPDVFEKILPLADRLPAASEVAAASDHARALEVVAAHLRAKDTGWQMAAVRSLRFLSAEEVFVRVSALFTGPDHTGIQGRNRVGAVLWAATPMESPRWMGFLTERLAVEAHPKVRGLIVAAFGALGLPAVEAIVGAAQDAEDNAVLREVPKALDRLRSDLARRGQWEDEGEGVIAVVRAAEALAAPKGPRQKVLRRALLSLQR